MKKYSLIASIFLCCNAYAQLIIGDLEIRATGKNQLTIKNISNKPIEDIKINKFPVKKSKRTLEPDQSQTFIFKSYNQTEKEKKEQEVLINLLDTTLIN